MFSPQSSQSLSPSLHSHRILSTPPLPAQPYCCDLCTMRFHSVSALQKHALTVHGFRAKEAGSLFCVHCRLQFPTPALFAEHYVLFHGTTIGLFAQTPVEQVKPTDLSLTKKSSPGEDIRPSKRLRHGENGISSSSNGVESSRKTSTVVGTLSQYFALASKISFNIKIFSSFTSFLKVKILFPIMFYEVNIHD